MGEERETLYDKISEELLAGFYYQIKMNIEKGILSNTMHKEIKLIKQSAKRRKIPMEQLHEQGKRIVSSHRTP
ncbi:hypothetical protein ACFSMW_08425 [Virgibacillus halophilus]|uniref:hypothetical protein n=1 Tax=Tigheibacillus halophilus TaxID=361280 RepID=UPI003624D6FD